MKSIKCPIDAKSNIVWNFIALLWRNYYKMNSHNAEGGYEQKKLKKEWKIIVYCTLNFKLKFVLKII